MSILGFSMESVSRRWHRTLGFCIKELKLTVDLPLGESPIAALFLAISDGFYHYPM